MLGIIALLIGVGTAFMKDVLGDAEEGRARADISTLSASLIRYKTKGGLYPTTAQGLDALVRKPSSGPMPRSYKSLLDEAALLDPWGNPYGYRYPGVNKPESYDLFSVGRDGKEGTEDDVTNW